MKLLTYQYKFFGPRAGMKLDDEVLDLTVLLNCRSSPISDIGALLRRFDDPVAAIQAALHSGEKQKPLPLCEVSLCPPILHPASLRDSSLFEAHSNGTSKSNGHTTPPIWYERPIYFYENPNDLTGPEAVISRKAGSVTLDYEAPAATSPQSTRWSICSASPCTTTGQIGQWAARKWVSWGCIRAKTLPQDSVHGSSPWTKSWTGGTTAGWT